jgi:iron complex transport system substrate-binding protein
LGRDARQRFLIALALTVLLRLFAAQHALAAIAIIKSPLRQTRVPEARSTARMVTDEVGRRVMIPADVRRIVSLAPNLTETLYALGVQDRLVGDTNYCDVPPEAKTKPHVGAPLSPSIEAIVGLRPDLVLATTSINRRETVDALAHLGVPVYTTDPHTVRAMVASFGRLADLMGAPQQGTELVSHLDARLNGLHARLADLPPVHVLFVVWLEPLITIGQNTFIADALRWAGAQSDVLSRQNWPQLSFEEVVRLDPEYIVIAGSHEGEGPRTLANLRGRAGWKDLQAVQAGHLAIISEEIDRPAPALIDAIEQLAKQLHPNAFSRDDRGTGRRSTMTSSALSFGPERVESSSCAR